MDPRIILLFSPPDQMHELLRPTTSTRRDPTRHHNIATHSPVPGTGKDKRRSARHFVTRLRRAINRAQDLFRASRSRPCLDC